MLVSAYTFAVLFVYNLFPFELLFMDYSDYIFLSFCSFLVSLVTESFVVC